MSGQPCMLITGKKGDLIFDCNGLVVFPPKDVPKIVNDIYNVEYIVKTNKAGKKYGVAVKAEHIHSLDKEWDETILNIEPRGFYYTFEKKETVKLACKCGYTKTVNVDAEANFVVSKVYGTYSTDSFLVPLDEQSAFESYRFVGFDASKLSPNIEYKSIKGVLFPTDVKIPENLDELLSYKEMPYDVYISNNIGFAKIDEFDAKCLEYREERTIDGEVSLTEKTFINTVRGIPIVKVKITIAYGDPDTEGLSWDVETEKLADFIYLSKTFVNDARLFAARFKTLYKVLKENGYTIGIRILNEDKVFVSVEKDGKTGEAYANAYEDYTDMFAGNYGIGYYGILAREIALMVATQLRIKKIRSSGFSTIPYVVPSKCKTEVNDT